MTKKIAIVSDTAYPFNKGGKEKRMYDIATRLVAEGNEVTIYCMKWWQGPRTIVREGVILESISPFYPLYAGKRRSIREAILFALHCFALLRKDFDVVDVDHMPQTVLLIMKIVCLLKRKPMVVTWHEVWGKEYWKHYAGFLGIVGYWFEKMGASFPNVIISVSEHTTTELRRVLHTNRPIVTVPNGIDVAVIRDALPSNRSSDILFAGRLLAHKNVDALLRSVCILKEKNPNISLLVVGEGPEKENLVALAKTLGIEKNVTFLDFYDDHRDLYAVMHASKLFVLPSTREGFGIVVIEANASGLPVVTIESEHNAAKDLILVGQNGALASLNPHDLAATIEKTLITRKEKEFYPQFVEQYDMRNVMPLILQAYAGDVHSSEQRFSKPIQLSYSLAASVVLLTYNSKDTVRAVLDGIFKQDFPNFEVICIDSSSTDGTRDILAEYPVRLVVIEPKDFGHGKTRNYAARLANGEFVVFLTHDSVPKDAHWLNEMLKPFASDVRVAGVYGRQIPRLEEKTLDKYFQASLYGDEGVVWEANNWQQGDNIFSDANSAVRRSVLLSQPYADNIIVSEDYEWAARVLRRGYKVVYSASATVIHSHSYTIGKLFKRNFDVGVSYRTIYLKGISPQFLTKGFTIMRQEVRYLYQSHQAKLIPAALWRDLVRFVAIELGRNEYLFSKNFKRKHLSSQGWYWK